MGGLPRGGVWHLTMRAESAGRAVDSGPHCRELQATPLPLGFSVLADGTSLFQSFSLENLDIKG